VTREDANFRTNSTAKHCQYFVEGAMDKYTQAGRPLAVRVKGLGEDDLLLERFTGHEAISELFHFRLEMLAEKPIEFAKVLGQEVTVELRPPGVFALVPTAELRYFHGIIKRLSQGEYVNGGTNRQDRFIRYEAEMAPALWLLTKRVQSRIFQQKTVPAILDQVLEDEWGLDILAPQFDEKPFYPRDYCVQYRESDFAFVSRLMEEEGIFYYFRHEKEDKKVKHTLVLGNKPEAHDELAGKVSYKEAPFEDCVHRWVKRQEVVTGQVTLWDSCFELPGKNLAAQRTISEQVVVGQSQHNLTISSNQPLEHYDYPGGYAQRFDGVNPGGANRADDLKHIYEDNERTAAIRMQEAAAAALRIDGASLCRHFGAGRCFKLVGHFDADDAKVPYLLTRVEHDASIQGAYRSGSQPPAPESYENRFQCLPGRVPFRPRRVTPRPTIPGPQTAVVVGLESKDDKPKVDEKDRKLDRGSFLDRYGRVKVQFPWDREGKHDAGSSCWVRVAQTWAGKRWGAFFWPHVGHEVVVAFEEGDPDRPLIVGSVYNAQNMPPFELPKEKQFNGIRSCSLGGDPATNFSGFVFHDVDGDEQFILHSRGDLFFGAEEDIHTNVRGHYHIKEGKSSIKTVGGPSGLFSSGSGGNQQGGGEKREESPQKEGPRAVSSSPVQNPNPNPNPPDPRYKLSNADKAKWTWSPTWQLGQARWTPTIKADVTCGAVADAWLGAKLGSSFGSNWVLNINPIGLLGELGAGPGGLALAAGWVGGRLNFDIGSYIKFQYGPSYSFDWGRKVQYTMSRMGPGSYTKSNVVRALAAAIAVTQIAGLLIWSTKGGYELADVELDKGKGPRTGEREKWEKQAAAEDKLDKEAEFVRGMSYGGAGSMGLSTVLTAALMFVQHRFYVAESLATERAKQFPQRLGSAAIDTPLRARSASQAASAAIWVNRDLLEQSKLTTNPGYEVTRPSDKVRPKTDVVTDGDWEVKAGGVQLGAFDKAPTVYVQAISTGSSPQGTITLVADDWTSIQGGKHGVDIRSNDPAGDIDIGGRMTSGVIKLRHGLQQVVLDKTSLKAEKFKDVVISALGSITLKVGKSQIRLDPRGVTIQGPIVKVEATGPARIEGNAVFIKSKGPGPVCIDSALPAGGILIG
jgi:type VI secretion system secreted protein VgrG